MDSFIDLEYGVWVLLWNSLVRIFSDKYCMVTAKWQLLNNKSLEYYFSFFINVPLADQSLQFSGQTVELSKRLGDLSVSSFLGSKDIRLKAVLSQKHAGKYQRLVIQSLARGVDISAHYQGEVGVPCCWMPVY